MALKDMKSIFGLDSSTSGPTQTKMKSDISIVQSIYGKNNLVSNVNTILNTLLCVSLS